MDVEREAFQEWYEADAMPAEADWFKLDADGDYDHGPTYWAWRGWQARASTQVEASETSLHSSDIAAAA
jgi:hypothetical protein